MKPNLSTLTAVLAFSLLACIPELGKAQQISKSRHQITDAVEIELSGGWRTATQRQAAEFEADRREIYARAGVEPKVNPRDTVSFQAEKSQGADSIALGITVMPGEASQAQVAQLSEQRIQQLGAVFAQQFRSVAASAGVTNVVFTQPALQHVGDKLAISYSTSFTTADGIRRTGIKYHVYMRNATVVVSATGADSIRQSLRDEASASIQTARLIER